MIKVGCQKSCTIAVEQVFKHLLITHVFFSEAHSHRLPTGREKPRGKLINSLDGSLTCRSGQCHV